MIYLPLPYESAQSQKAGSIYFLEFENSTIMTYFADAKMKGL